MVRSLWNGSLAGHGGDHLGGRQAITTVNRIPNLFEADRFFGIAGLVTGLIDESHEVPAWSDQMREDLCMVAHALAGLARMLL